MSGIEKNWIQIYLYSYLFDDDDHQVEEDDDEEKKEEDIQLITEILTTRERLCCGVLSSDCLTDHFNCGRGEN